MEAIIQGSVGDKCMNSKIKIQNFINEYTKDVKIKIPSIQRNYKWNRGNVDKEGNKIEGTYRGIRSTAHNLIWEIIYNYKNNQKSMNLGLVVLYDNNIDNNTDRMILDGQQRIITLSLIVRYLVYKLNEKREVDKEKLKLEDEWFTFQFDRDFEQNGQAGIRYNFMFDEWDLPSEITSVDIKRMVENTKEIDCVVKALEFEEYNALLKYIKNNVFFIVRVTTTPPLDEFLNVNSNKTPFSICDFIKIFLLKDIFEDTNIDEEERNGRKREVLSLYSEIASYLYKRKNQEDNELYKMISVGYSNIINHPEINRMDLIFEDRYYVDKNNVIKSRWKKDVLGKPTLIKLEQSEVLDKYEKVENEDCSPYKQAIARLRYFRNVLKGIEEELYTKDKNDKDHINSNAFNTFYVLNKYTNNTFFSLFSEEDIKIEADPNFVIKEFCLQEFCADQTRKMKNRKASNALMESVMQTEIKKEIHYDYEIEDNGTFDEMSDIFFKCYDDYTNLVKIGKQRNAYTVKEIKIVLPDESSENERIENNSHSIKKLCECTKKIIIPDIQRDFIKGCSAGDFLEDIVLKNSVFLVDRYIEDKEIDISDLARRIYQHKREEYTALPEQEKGEYESYAKEMIRNMMIALLCSNKDKISLSDATRCHSTLRYLVKSASIDVSNVSNYHAKKRIEDMINCARKIAGCHNEKLKNDFCSDSREAYTASCVVGFWDKNKNLFIYDGQQRLSFFLCAIGYLKRKTQDVPEEVNNLYERFEYSGRSEANGVIKCLYTSTEDGETLVSNLLQYVCDQTTESIYMLTKTLMDMCKRGVYIPYNYFYDMMKVEFYCIDDRNETTQLFMDLSDGLPLNPSEIYKAEFSHYLTENIEQDKGSVTAILNYLDNAFVDLFIGENEPEVKEIQYLKELLQLTLIERYNDFVYGNMPKLSDLRDKFSEKEVIQKLKEYIEKFINFYNSDSETNKTVNEFCNSNFYYDINHAKYDSLYCEYSIQEGQNGGLAIYSNYQVIEKLYNEEYSPTSIPFDLKVKLIYNFSKNGYLESDSCFTIDYLLENSDANKRINTLLKKMAQKSFRDRKDVEQITYSPCSIPTVSISLSGKENRNNIFDEIMSSEETGVEEFENMFYGKSMEINMQNVLQKIKEVISQNVNSNIYRALYNNYDIFSYNNKKEWCTVIWDGSSYKLLKNKIRIHDLELEPPTEEIVIKQLQFNINEANKIYKGICNIADLSKKKKLLDYIVKTDSLEGFRKVLIEREFLKVDNTKKIFVGTEQNKDVVLVYNEQECCTNLEEVMVEGEVGKFA